MRLKRLACTGLLLVSCAWLADATTSHAGAERGDGSPIVVGGQRVVELRNNSGGLSLYTQIPTSSAFSKHGGAGAPCTFTAKVAGVTSDGQAYLPGDVVQSQRWVFQEGPWLLWTPTPPEPAEQVGRGPLSTALRWFKVFCDVASNYTFQEYRSVLARDIVFDPFSRLTDLYGRLQLVEPIVYRNPIVDRWGGLVVRYPAWLAILPDAWTTQITTPPLEWRGWVMDLVAQPSELSFEVDFTPNPDKPAAPFHGIVPCVAPGEVPPTDGAVLPAVPDLPEQTEPGVNGPCTWTPPGPGTVTIQARLTFSVTLRASGYTDPRPDYVWTSAPVTFSTGELTSVNLDPTGT